VTLSLPTLRAHADQLLAALDEEIRLLEIRTSQMKALSAAIVERAESAMENLLGEMQQAQDAQAGVDARLKQTRAALAGDLACPERDVKLGWLAERLGEPQRTQIRRRRRRVLDLAEALRQQQLRTSILLAECARVNRLLLESLFPRSKAVDTYSGRGPERWRPDTGVVSAER